MSHLSVNNPLLGMLQLQRSIDSLIHPQSGSSSFFPPQQEQEPLENSSPEFPVDEQNFSRPPQMMSCSYRPKHRNPSTCSTLANIKAKSKAVLLYSDCFSTASPFISAGFRCGEPWPPPRASRLKRPRARFVWSCK